MSADRRTYAREYARKRRARAFAERLRGAVTCPRKEGKHGVCGGRLETIVGEFGRTVVSCPRCIRRERGICRDCTAPVVGAVGKALRCAQCKHAALLRARRKSLEEHREETNARARELAQRPDVRARRLEYKRAYRKANPEKVRAWKYREAVSEGRSRTRHLRYHRRYNARKSRAEKKRAAALLAYYATHPERPVARCRGCAGFLDWTPAPGRGRPPAWCDDCASPVEQKRRVKLGRSFRVVPEPPAPTHVPQIALARAFRLVGGPRTCLTAGCDTEVTGRAKKCTACKARERSLAAALLELHRGRGRRTDLAPRSVA